MKKLLILFTFILAWTVSAKTIPCRSGEVLNAEFTSKKVEIANFNKQLFGKDSARNYAVVAIRLSAKRSISIFDYKLMVNNESYPVVAIQKNYNGFEYTKNKLVPDSENDIFFLLFFVDSSMSNSSYELQANFLPVDMAQVKLPFKNLNGRDPSDSTMINYNGNF